MFLKWLFGAKPADSARRTSGAAAGADGLRAELELCLARSGGRIATARRAGRLVAGLREGAPSSLPAAAEVIGRLNDGAAERTAAHYSRMEESEFFGRQSSRLAFFDAFETPRRRILALLCAADGGRDLLERLAQVACAELAADIRDVLAGR